MRQNTEGLISTRTRRNANKQVQNRKIGNAVFSLSFTQKEYKLMRQKNYQQFSKTSWGIVGENYKTYKWSQLFSHMKQAFCRELVITRTKNPRIPREISHIVFHQLIFLSLSQNKITNLESLQFIEMPNLNYLMLSFNLVTNANFLCKLKLNNLASLSLQQNHIKELDHAISRFFAPKSLNYFRFIVIDTQAQSQKNHTMPENLNFLSKLEHREGNEPLNIYFTCKYWTDRQKVFHKNSIIYLQQISQAIRRKYNSSQV